MAAIVYEFISLGAKILVIYTNLRSRYILLDLSLEKIDLLYF